jgi:hypothetical protein
MYVYIHTYIHACISICISIYIHIYTHILQVLALRAALWEQNGTLPTPGEWKSRKDKGEAEVYSIYICCSIIKCMCVCVCIEVYTDAVTYKCVYKFTYEYMHIYICIYIYIYIYIYIGGRDGIGGELGEEAEGGGVMAACFCC